jgi:glutathione S-transferase
MALPILYSFRRCPYAMRARLAIDASGRVCELREVVLRNKPPELLHASAKGTVPVVIDADGRVIDESLDIMLWALHGADPECWLGEADSLQQTLAVIQHFDTHFKAHLDRYKYPNRFVGADAQASRSAALELCGHRPTLLDMALAPFVRQFAHVDAGWFASQPLANVHAWLQRIVESARFTRIMRPVAPWLPGTQGVPFPFVV